VDIQLGDSSSRYFFRRRSSPVLIFRQLHEVLEGDTDIDDVKKSKISLYMADVDLALVDGADEYLQLLALGSHVIQVLSNAI
jgi:DNA polymerase III delta prime subunit